MSTVDIANNNHRNNERLDNLNNELELMQKEIILKKKKQLQLENEQLRQALKESLGQLIALEIRNGKRQMPIVINSSAIMLNKKSEKSIICAVKSAQKQQPKNEKTFEPNKSSGAVESLTDINVHVGRLDMRVGKIIEVQQHPDAENLYLEKIDCGEAQPRTVVSGLVKFIPLEEMQNRMVVVLCNLKPAKMRGIISEAMVMCASTPQKVELLSPPADAVPGDVIDCEGYTRQPDAQLNPKKKIFETCAPDLMTNEQLIACYKNSPLHILNKGNLTAQTLKNVNIK